MASLALLISLGGLAPSVVMADTAKSTVCQSIDAGADCGTTPNGSVDVTKVPTTIVNVLSTVVGVVAVIMIIVGGFKIVTSGGDSNKVASGRSTVLYAVIGLIVVILARIIVNYVLTRVN